MPRRTNLFFDRLGRLTACTALLVLNLSFVGAPTSFDPLLAQAEASAEKAVAQIMAAENEGVVPPFNGYDVKAITLLQQARRTIRVAMAYAGSTSGR